MALRDILESLVRYDVRFIIVGGLAAVLQGVPVQTLDVDIVYARDDENVAHLLAALRALNAVFRDDARRIERNESHLRSPGQKLLRTSHGVLDALGTVEQGTGYDELFADTELMDVRGLRIRVVTLERLIRIKRALHRPKDVAMLPLLEATLAERQRSG